MKFSNIKRVTQWGNYKVDLLLDDIERWISSRTKEYNLDLDPDFQRGHVWTVTQQKNFVEFLLRGGQSGRNIFFNCRNFRRGSGNNMELVDGKQRITAIRKFLNNELAIFDGCYFKDFTDNLPTDIFMSFWVNDLPDRKDVLEWYLEINAGTPHTEDELVKVMEMIESCTGEGE
jgi:hypothetical protein